MHSCGLLSRHCGFLHAEYVPFRGHVRHQHGHCDVLCRSVPSRCRLRHNVPGDEFTLHKSCAQQSARHRHKHISYGVGCGYRYRHCEWWCDSPALHVLYGLSHRFGALCRLASVLHNAGHSTLQPQQVEMTIRAGEMRRQGLLPALRSVVTAAIIRGRNVRNAFPPRLCYGA